MKKNIIFTNKQKQK